MGKVEISLDDYVNAPDDSLLIKKNGEWRTITLKELIKNTKNKPGDLEKVTNDLQNLSRNVKHFKVYAKSHFMVVFNSFKIQVLGGFLDVNDTQLLNLDSDVLDGKISVEEAIKKHQYIETLFNKLFVEDKEVYKEV